MDRGRNSWLLRSTKRGPRVSGPKPTRPNLTSTHRYDWREGDIAFLLTWDFFAFQDKEALIHSGHLEKKATSHPVIILQRHSSNCTHVLITPISAYSSNEHNNWLPPWKQPYHTRKNPHDFRSFQGTERFSQTHDLLQIEGGRFLPKPRGSWVYIQSVFLVPVTVLGAFDKVEGDRLRVTEDSRKDLLRHMTEKNWTVAPLLKNPLLSQTAAPPLQREQLFQRDNWRDFRRWSSSSTSTSTSTSTSRSTSTSTSTSSAITSSQASTGNGFSVGKTGIHTGANRKSKEAWQAYQPESSATTWASRAAFGALVFNNNSTISESVQDKRKAIQQPWRTTPAVGVLKNGSSPTIKSVTWGRNAPQPSWALVPAGPKPSQRRLIEVE